MKVISWNVAGIRAALKKGLSDFFYKEDADIFCMQEVKATDDQFSFAPTEYHKYLFPAERKGYSGTIIYSKEKPLDVSYGIGFNEFDLEGRIITLEFEKFYLVTVYVPNVKRDLSRMDSRMNFDNIFREYLIKLDKTKPLIICGDFNVAHNEIDIKNYKANYGNAGFTKEERDSFSLLLNSGFIDTYRYFNPEKTGAYTWWSYLYNARANNAGWRIDYFLVSKRIIDSVKMPIIYNNIMGSDHCPIGLIIENM